MSESFSGRHALGGTGGVSCPSCGVSHTRQARGAFLRSLNARLGWWAVGLAAGVVVLLPILGVIGAAVITDPGWGASLALGLSGAVAVATALAAGVVAVVKGERSILLLGPLLFGAFWVMFVLGEFLSPH